MSDFSRREFLKRSAAAGVASGVTLTGFGKNAMASDVAQVGTMIDLTRCDGCKGLDTPACVTACREENKDRFPDPVKDIPNNWPQNKKEDWSDKKGLTNRLTPYNWTFVQRVDVKHNGRKYTLHVPRRCMHCDNPPCADVCPLSANHKMPEGPVIIDPDICLGGAKCRSVCPWGIPARQAGVGLYMKMLPGIMGGGVMYKCDLCYSRIKSGREPACVEACPHNAIVFGEKEKMRVLAHKRASEINGYIYGEKENGGTSTFYVSPVPFEKINAELMKQKTMQSNPKAPGFPGMPGDVENFTETTNGIAWSMAIAPVAGIAAAAGVAYKTMKGDKNDE